MVPEPVGKFLPWRLLLEALGAPAAPSAAALPATVACPACSGRLLVQADDLFASYWYYCRDCGVNGDGVALAAKTWGMEAPDAVHRLAARGIRFPKRYLAPSALAYNCERHTEAHARVQEWLRQAGADLDAGKSGPVERLLAVARGAPAARDTAGAPGRPTHAELGLAAVSRDWLAAHLDPKSLRHMEARGRHASAPRAGRVPAWSQALGMVYEDVPHRPRGVLLWPNHLEFPGGGHYVQIIRLPSMTNATDLVARREAGLWGLGAALARARDAGSPVFAVTDAALALRWRFQHLASTGEALPIVAPWHGARWSTYLAWSHLRGRRGVLITARVDEEAMRVGRLLDWGLVELRPARTGPPPGPEWLAWALAHGEPWTFYMRRDAPAHGPGWAEAAFQKIGASEDERAAISTNWPAVFQQTLVAPPRSVGSGAVRVIESDGQWRTPKGRLVCDAVLRVDRVVHGEESDESAEALYEGRVLWQGHEWPFQVDTARSRAFFTSTLAWLRRFVAKRGGVVCGEADKLGVDLVRVARDMSPPLPVFRPTRVGASSEGYVFPRYIERWAGGAVPLAPPIAPRRGTYAFHKLEAPSSAAPPLAWSAPPESAGAVEAGMVFCAIAWHMLASRPVPGLRRPSPRTAIVERPPFPWSRAVGGALGLCRPWQGPDRLGTRFITGRHVPYPTDRKTPHRDHVLLVSEREGAALALRDDWTVIDVTENNKGPVSGSLFRAAFAAFWRALCERRVHWRDLDDRPLAALFREYAAWAWPASPPSRPSAFLRGAANRSCGAAGTSPWAYAVRVSLRLALRRDGRPPGGLALTRSGKIAVPDDLLTKLSRQEGDVSLADVARHARGLGEAAEHDMRKTGPRRLVAPEWFEENVCVPEAIAPPEFPSGPR